jgi:hypothetical protein
MTPTDTSEQGLESLIVDVPVEQGLSQGIFESIDTDSYRRPVSEARALSGRRKRRTLPDAEQRRMRSSGRRKRRSSKTRRP